MFISIPYWQPKLSYKLLVTVISSSFVSSLLLACQPQMKEPQAIEIQDAIGKVFITDTAITVQPEHIAHIKSERYQPSLSLYGRLIPIKRSFIRAPQKIKLLQVLVNKGQSVKEGQLLITALPTTTLPINVEKDVNIETDTDINLHSTITNSNDDNNQGTENIGIKNIGTENIKDIKIDGATDNGKKINKIGITAPFAGKVQHLYYQQDTVFHRFTSTVVEKDQPLMILTDDSDWQFISLLPAYTKSKLSIGQHVNFSLRHDKNNTDKQAGKQHEVKLTGQIIDLSTDSDKAMRVTVHVLPNRGRPFPLKQGMAVQGKVDYGQIEVGTLISKAGVHPILTHDTYGGLATDLSVFNQPNAHVVAPVKAYVWIVNHSLLIITLKFNE